MTKVFVLLIVFQFKHFLADYPFQRPYMLQKFRADWGFFWPLVAHCLVHACMTGIISNVVCPGNFKLLALCMLTDFVVHFAMDRIKAGPKYLGRFKALSAGEFKGHLDNIKRNSPGCELSASALRGNTFFWWSLGLDQMVHHLTDLGIVYLLVS